VAGIRAEAERDGPDPRSSGGCRVDVGGVGLDVAKGRGVEGGGGKGRHRPLAAQTVSRTSDRRQQTHPDRLEVVQNRM
jgi:hypothetical protein